MRYELPLEREGLPANVDPPAPSRDRLHEIPVLTLGLHGISCTGLQRACQGRISGAQGPVDFLFVCSTRKRKPFSSELRVRTEATESKTRAMRRKPGGVEDEGKWGGEVSLEPKGRRDGATRMSNCQLPTRRRTAAKSPAGVRASPMSSTSSIPGGKVGGRVVVVVTG